jgi:hypothetical protein
MTTATARRLTISTVVTTATTMTIVTIERIATFFQLYPLLFRIDLN